MCPPLILRTKSASRNNTSRSSTKQSRERVERFKTLQFTLKHLKTLQPLSLSEIWLTTLKIPNFSNSEFSYPRKIESDDDVPLSFCCPITCDIMKDPVICADGQTYEQEKIDHFDSEFGLLFLVQLAIRSDEWFAESITFFATFVKSI